MFLLESNKILIFIQQHKALHESIIHQNDLQNHTKVLGWYGKHKHIFTNLNIIKQFLFRIHPIAFDENYEPCTTTKGLTEIELAEGVKLQLVNILDHICDIQLRHQIESLISFTEGFVGDLQQDQCKRYMEIKQTDMPPAEAAKKTKEFRCPPKEQMFRLLNCKTKETGPMMLDDDVE